MSEKRDLYNEKRIFTNQVIHEEDEIPEDRYILIVSLFIQNSKGEFLIQKRSAEKGSKYGITSGHVKHGNNSINGMISETKEELGLEVKKNEMKTFYTCNDEKAFYDLYYLKKDIDIYQLNLQKEEVDSVEWFSANEISNLIKEGKFHQGHAEAFEEVMKYIKNQER